MKTTLLTCFLLALLASSCLADGATEQTTSDAEAQKQVEALTATQQKDYGDHYHALAVQVVQWCPYDLEWDVNKGHRQETGRYLVVQKVDFGRSKNVEYDTALVAEFPSADTMKSPRQVGQAPSATLK